MHRSLPIPLFYFSDKDITQCEMCLFCVNVHLYINRTPRTFPWMRTMYRQTMDAYKTFVQICLLLWEKGDYFTIVKWWMRSNLTLRTSLRMRTMYRQTIVGERLAAPVNVRLAHSPRLHRSCEHISLNYVSYSAFSRKRRNQKCLHCVPLRGNRRVLRTPGLQSPAYFRVRK